MKSITLTIALTFISFLGFAQDTKGITITVTIDNVKNDNGHVLLGLHSEDTFMKRQDIQSSKSEIKDGKITASFTNIPSGTYAIMALHDANDNERMDFEPSGMPAESYGLSNNPMSYGPPQFSEAKFEVTDKNLELNIRF